MASGDQMKKVVGMMLTAIVLFIAAADANPEQETAGSCVSSTSDVPGAANPCICSKNCACAGKCILNAGDGSDVKTCFVECVLKNDCGGCTGPLPATLDKTLRLNVTRPKVVSRSSKETLVIDVAVKPALGTGAAVFDVYLNAPEGGEVSKDSKHYFWTFVGTPNIISEKDVRRPVSDALRTIGAAEVETIVVSLVPKAWGERVTILSVRIE